jgi:hypothetical protein
MEYLKGTSRLPDKHTLESYAAKQAKLAERELELLQESASAGVMFLASPGNTRSAVEILMTLRLVDEARTPAAALYATTALWLLIRNAANRDIMLGLTEDDLAAQVTRQQNDDGFEAAAAASIAEDERGGKKARTSTSAEGDNAAMATDESTAGEEDGAGGDDGEDEKKKTAKKTKEERAAEMAAAEAAATEATTGGSGVAMRILSTVGVKWLPLAQASSKDPKVGLSTR